MRYKRDSTSRGRGMNHEVQLKAIEKPKSPLTKLLIAAHKASVSSSKQSLTSMITSSLQATKYYHGQANAYLKSVSYTHLTLPTILLV